MEKMLDKEHYVCKVAMIDKTVLGFCLCKIVDQAEICEYLRINQNDLPKYVICADKIGVIKTIAILNKFQHRGIGYALIFAAYNDLIKHDIQAISSIAWKKW